MSSFQVIVTGVFVFFIVLGVLVFAGFGGLGGGEDAGVVVIWGTVSERVVSNLIGNLAALDDSFDQVTYVEKKPETYTKEIIDAIAAVGAPDLFLLPQDEIVSLSDKVLPIPYGVMSERRFRDAFIDEGELYLREGGIMGMPLLIDPLVMYFN